jgi:DNA modification methylase
MSSGAIRRPKRARAESGARRANLLDGRTWTHFSVSVWSDIKKTPEERALRHPALFPAELPGRLIDCLCGPQDRRVLDPFAGMGSTLIAAVSRGLEAVGLDISSEYVETARRRLTRHTAGGQARLCAHELEHLLPAQGRPATSAPMGTWKLHHTDARRLLDYVQPDSVDLVVTSPPYWNVLARRRSADRKPVRSYSVDAPSGAAGENATARDLSSIEDYGKFLDALEEIFGLVFQCLRPGRFCCAVIMDLRKAGRFYPFHSDLAERMSRIGFLHEDIIIWDRRQEYSNFRPLGYPYVFRVNKAHEYILIFRKSP